MTFREWKMIFTRMCDVVGEPYPRPTKLHELYESGRTAKEALDYVLTEPTATETDRF